MKQRCRNCRYYIGPQDACAGLGEHGACRLMPPTFLRAQTDFPQTAFTFTQPDWWCGQWDATEGSPF